MKKIIWHERKERKNDNETETSAEIFHHVLEYCISRNFGLLFNFTIFTCVILSMEFK